MESKDNKVQVSFRLADSVKARLEVKLANERRDQTEVLTALVEQYLGGHAAIGAPTKKDQRWHDMLADILSSGDKGSIDAVQQNLLTFHRLVEILKGTQATGLRTRAK